jgi:hypothetical protein
MFAALHESESGPCTASARVAGMAASRDKAAITTGDLVRLLMALLGSAAVSSQCPLVGVVRTRAGADRNA